MSLALWHWHIEVSSKCTLKCPRCPRQEVPDTLVSTELKLDFFKFDYEPIKDKTIHIIGNPPFGSQSSTCKSFIKYCCKFATTISFILPKSFKKESCKKIFLLNFHLKLSIDLDDDAFTLDDAATIDKDYYGNKGNVFQILDILNIEMGRGFTDSYTVGDVVAIAMAYNRTPNETLSTGDVPVINNRSGALMNGTFFNNITLN